MCGIAGFFSAGSFAPAPQGLEILNAMTDKIIHRGPDEGGAWNDEATGVYLGHRRLSIIDLSAAGAQPMISHSGRFVMVFNGEIYNAPDLAKMLRGFSPRGHSDTEILLEAFSLLGVDETLRLIKGMFAIALWDRQEQKLFFMRDHVGKKPLYYGLVGPSLVFASELKAIRVFAQKTQQKMSIHRDALAAYTRFGFIPAPLSIYQGIYKLKPAHILEITAQDLQRLIVPSSRAFWALKIGQRNQHADQESLKSILMQAVKGRMLSDVPLGAFLSGGIDSSLVTALMQEASTTPIKTYSIGFESAAFDESVHAENVARHLGCDHTTYRVSAKDCLDIIPHLPHIYDEPFADYSQIPTAILCREARKDTVVALSGDGGDEVFCGYARYFMLQKLRATKSKMPAVARVLASSLLRLPNQGMYNALGLNGRRVHSIAGFLGEKDLRAEILRTVSVCPDLERLGVADSPLHDLDALFAQDGLDDLERMMLVDTALYLPDDILVKVDRASMFSALEVRSPLLDKDVLEWAWRVPIQDKIFDGQGRGKKPLYDLLCTYVPQAMIDRPKQGFSPPISAWLKGELRDWAENLLDPAALRDTGLYDPQGVSRMWAEFKAGKADHHTAIWTVLMAQSWYFTHCIKA